MRNYRHNHCTSIPRSRALQRPKTFLSLPDIFSKEKISLTDTKTYEGTRSLQLGNRVKSQSIYQWRANLEEEIGKNEAHSKSLQGKESAAAVPRGLLSVSAAERYIH